MQVLQRHAALERLNQILTIVCILIPCRARMRVHHAHAKVRDLLVRSALPLDNKYTELNFLLWNIAQRSLLKVAYQLLIDHRLVYDRLIEVGDGQFVACAVVLHDRPFDTDFLLSNPPRCPDRWLKPGRCRLTVHQ